MSSPAPFQPYIHDSICLCITVPFAIPTEFNRFICYYFCALSSLFVYHDCCTVKDTDLNRARHRHSWTHFYPHFPSTIKRNKCTSRRNKLFSSQPFLFLRLLQADLSQGQDCLYGVTLYLAWNLIYPMNCRIVFVMAARDQIKKTKTKPNKQTPPNKTHKQKTQKKNWRHQQCWEFKSFLESS